MSKTLTGKIVVSYLEKFPNQSSRSLSRLICEENPLVFNDTEHARMIIRSYRGALGEKRRKDFKDHRFFRTGFNLPEGEEKLYEPYQLPKVNNRILYMCDVHLPFHDLSSIKIALNDAKDKDCNTVILGGDIIDMYEQSSFDKIPNKSNFIKEREMFWQLIDDINNVLPKAKLFWIEGNHEYRFSRYMLCRSAEIYGVDDFTMRSLFSVREMGIEYIDRKQYIKAGELNILHGHEVGSFSSAVNAARGMYLRTKDSAVFGHLHGTSEHSEPDLRGDVKTCYAVGCLCYLHPEYRPVNRWNTGFALIEIRNDGYMVKNKKIVDGRIQ
jgi:predicted phosphodiesterase